MSTTNQTPNIGHLISPLKRDNVRLYQILNQLDKYAQSLKDEATQVETVALNFPIRLDIPGVMVVANDVLLSRYQVRLPLDEDNNLLAQKLQLQYLSISAKIPPNASSFIFDILVSNDLGVTFKSLFPPTNALKPFLPVNLAFMKYSAFAIDQLFDGDFLRVDILQADGVVSGVQLYLLGNLTLVP